MSVRVGDTGHLHKSLATISINLHKQGQEARGALEGLAARFADKHGTTSASRFGNSSGRMVK